MKILHVNTYDYFGGAAKATYRLHHALLKNGVSSRMLVQKKTTDESSVISINNTKIEKIFTLFRHLSDDYYMRSYKKPDVLFSPATSSLGKVIDKVNALNPDIVHLHWICGSFISIEDLSKIKKPIVWSLHDNWAFTGGCHVKWECNFFENECNNCPRLNSNKYKDLSYHTFLRKKKVYDNLKSLKIIGLSGWMVEKAKKSSLLKNRDITHIPNLIDINLFKPFGKKIARNILNLPLDAKIIAFGAVYATSDINKGYYYLKEILKLINSEIEIIVFGGSAPNDDLNCRNNIKYLGHIYDDYTLSVIYNAVDIVIVPSIQENLSNVIMESMSCGTPVVAFDVGGNSDLIKHTINGYLVKPFEVGDFNNAFEWIFNNYEKVSNSSREFICDNFNEEKIVNRYIAEYLKILNF